MRKLIHMSFLTKEKKFKMYKFLFTLATFLLFGGLSVLAQQTKSAITNADVIEMVKTGISENIIVLAIQKSDPNFDTSAKSIIELKKQGVSQKILEAMLEAGTKTPLRPQNTAGSNTPARPKTLDAFDNLDMIGGGVKIIVGNTSEKLSTILPMGTKFSKLGAMNPFGKSKIILKLNGDRADYRITSGTPEFEVFASNSLNAAKSLLLIKVNSKSDGREIEMSGGEFRKENIIPTFIEKKNETTFGMTKLYLYRIKVKESLLPGEYVYSTGGMYFDFGVDAPKN